MGLEWDKKRYQLIYRFYFTLFFALKRQKYVIIHFIYAAMQVIMQSFSEKRSILYLLGYLALKISNFTVNKLQTRISFQQNDNSVNVL